MEFDFLEQLQKKSINNELFLKTILETRFWLIDLDLHKKIKKLWAAEGGFMYAQMKK